MKQQILNNSIQTECFSNSYPFINKFLVENGDVEESRNGDTKEILNFKTEIFNPYKRCAGNNYRNSNIFFLLAEALWIFSGRKDVEFLTKFNNQMKEYSDDGKSFHAPYGFRMRHYGVSSFDNTKPTSPENNGHAVQQMIDGIDQIEEALNMLSVDKDSRRVVISIWNPELDLNVKSKDLPCNDLLMLKIRNGKMHSTIANRSNDLHWGLPTNVFQFSFITELMSNILGVELGTQTHNSQSLHFYLDNPIAMRMYDNMTITNSKFEDIYQNNRFDKIDTNFTSNSSVSSRLKSIDQFINLMLDSLSSGEYLSKHDLRGLKDFSKYFHTIYEILWNYLTYKFGTLKNDEDKIKKIQQLQFLLPAKENNLDIITMAQNFYFKRIKADFKNNINKQNLGIF